MNADDTDAILEVHKALKKLDDRIIKLDSIKGLDNDYKNPTKLQIEIGARLKAIKILEQARTDLHSAIG